VCIFKQSWSQKCSQGVPEKMLLSSLEESNMVPIKMITPAPGYSLIIIRNCPHLEGWSVLHIPVFFMGRFSPLS
jgi:hypothetical protein